MLQSIVYKFIQFLYYVYRLLPFAPKGKTVLVTGASKGIGRDVALELAKNGLDVILTARNEKQLRAVKEEIVSKYNVKAYAVPFDVTEFDHYDELFERATHLAGPIDTIVLNAGVNSTHAVGSKGAFDKDLSVLETNLLGPMSCINVFVSYAKQFHIKDPHVVVVTSVAADIARSQKGAYSASKAALSIFLESAAMELESEGFWFTNIKPGFIKTEMTSYMKGDSLKVTSEYAAKEIAFAMRYRFNSWFTPVLIYWPLVRILNPLIPFRRQVVRYLTPVGKSKVQ
eukprot:NODE_229_length_12207_cov_1.116700.p6 type:complete len:285 gc:universal NODE_229_length_12207_cov_1.116700:5772-4918(-)